LTALALALKGRKDKHKGSDGAVTKNANRNEISHQNNICDSEPLQISTAASNTPTKIPHWSTNQFLNSYDLFPLHLSDLEVQQLRAEVFQKGLEYDEESKTYFFLRADNREQRVIHTSYYELHRQLYILNSSPGIFESEAEREMPNQLEKWLHRSLTWMNTHPLTDSHNPDPETKCTIQEQYLKICKRMSIEIYDAYGCPGQKAERWKIDNKPF